LKNCSVLIPIYDDYDSLVSLLELIDEDCKRVANFIIVDNGSTDKRVRLLLEEKSFPYFSSEANLGFGGAVIFGAERVLTPWVAWMPGNLKVNPQDLSNYLKSFEFPPNTFVKANRVNRRRVDHLKTILAGLIQSSILGKNMIDTGGTPTICEREFLISLKNPPSDFVFESFTLFAARSQKLSVIRPPFAYGQRKFGRSHWQRGLKSEMNLMVRIIRSCLTWRKLNQNFQEQ
jgi:glycosyltransferase involved in cell wall biosynthesis